MKRKGFMRLFSIAVLTTLTIALSACSGDKQGENSSQITIGIPQDLEDSLDPNKTVAAGTKEIYFNIYEGLVKPDSDGNIYPAVASDYKVSEDQCTYTFTLREGVKFHDGSLVTVEDIKHTLDKCAFAGNGDPLVEAFSNVESINVIDDKTVEIVLVQPSADFIAGLADINAAIVPASNTDPDKVSIGTGPYKYVSRSPQENFILEKFDEYWGEPAKIETVILKICSNVDSIVMDLNGGSIDMFARLTTAQADQLSGDYNVLEGSMNLVQAMYLNNEAEPFNDIRVRQALCYAIDKEEIMLMIADGKGTPIGSSMFPAFGKYYMPELNDVYATDIEKAKELLTEAGYPDGFSFTVKVPSNYTPHIDTAQVIAEQLKDINVNAKIELIEWDSWLSDVYAGRDYQATVVGVDASSLTASALLMRFNSEASNNFVNFKNEAYDTAFANAQATVDDAAQTAYYKECLQILSDEAANVYIQDLAELVALNKRFAGYEFYPLYVQDFSKLYIVE